MFSVTAFRGTVANHAIDDTNRRLTFSSAAPVGDLVAHCAVSALVVHERTVAAMTLTDFEFSYPHETAQCLLSTRNVGAETYFYFEIEGKGRGRGRRDIALTTRVSIGRILGQEGCDPVSLATELLSDVYSHGEPQRRKPADRESALLLASLVAWIKRNRAEAAANPKR